VYKTAVVECRVCGDEGVLAVDVVVKAAEIATFAAAHSDHARFDIHLRLAASDGCPPGSLPELGWVGEVVEHRHTALPARRTTD
jgi:hypothetical protein